MASSGHSYRRRRLVVNPALQFGFVKALLAVLGCMALATLLAVHVAIRLTLRTFGLGGDLVMTSLFSAIFWTVVLELVLISPVVIWFGIVMTHKIAGPLVRIHAALAEMAQGRYDIHLTLRKGDQLVDLAEAINRVAASLRRRSEHPTA